MLEYKVTFKGVDALYVKLAAEKINLRPTDYIKLVLRKHFKDFPIDPPDWIITERERENRSHTTKYEKALLESFITYNTKLKEYWEREDGMGSSFG